MDSNALPGGMYGAGHNVQTGGHHHHTMMLYPPHEAQQSYPVSSKPETNNNPLTLSDDDDNHNHNNNNNGLDDDDKIRKMSPWHRMKWTDNMVRLLIMLVYYIGDEVVVSDQPSNDPPPKKSAAAGVSQKKGKWKSVSRAMMERGFYVSPQQCEDKFNDLNKRYKRVNDILGKGTACLVVENQSLLETMDHLSSKAKEEVKKLLNSKHLFFREMCAYHNSCGHNTVQSSAAQAQSCLHDSKEKPGVVVQHNSSRSVKEGSSKMGRAKTIEAQEDDSDDDDDDEEDEEDEDGEDEDEGSLSKKRMRELAFISPLNKQLDAEVANIFQDLTKSSSEKRRWMKAKLLGLEEQRVDIQSRALEVEKRRFKWQKFRTEKEREMEREKLTIERLKLENERMAILIRRREIELMDHQQHQQQQRSDPSSSIIG